MPALWALLVALSVRGTRSARRSDGGSGGERRPSAEALLQRSSESNGFPVTPLLAGGLVGAARSAGTTSAGEAAHRVPLEARGKRPAHAWGQELEASTALSISDKWPVLWRDSLDGLELVAAPDADDGVGSQLAIFTGRIVGKGFPVTVYQVTPHTPDEWTFWRNEVQVAQRFNGGDFATLMSSLEFEHPVFGQSILLCRADGAKGPGTLTELMMQDDRTEETVPMDVKVKIMIELSGGLATMAKAGYIHSSLSPDTVLLNGDCSRPSECHAQLDIFGHARNIKRSSRVARPHENDFYAERQYIAPEVGMEQSEGTRRDVWSLGVMFYELLHAGILPLRMYDAFESDEDFMEYVAFRFNIADDKDFQDLEREIPSVALIVKRMLQRDPKRRWSAARTHHELVKVGRRFPRLQVWLDATRP